MQEDSETVADYVYHLEKAFRVAFGSDGLSRETEEAMLYGQLQEGLRLGIIRSPSVSGALNYKGVCAWLPSTRNKGRLNMGSVRNIGNHRVTRRVETRVDDWTSERPIRQNITPTNKRCYVCNQVGHLAKNCKTNSKEQESQITSGQKKDPSKGNTRQVTIESSNDHLSASANCSRDISKKNICW